MSVPILKKIVSIKSTLFKKKSLKKYISSQGNIAFEKKGNNFLEATSLLATLAWQIAKQLQGLNFFSPSNNKNYRLTKNFFFLINLKQLLNRQCIKIQLPQKHYWESFKNYWSEISILNSENYCILHGHRLLDKTTKQPLSNFEPRKLWKYRQFCGLTLDPSCLWKKCEKINCR